MTDQLRPLEAEAAVVGSILIDPACLPAVEEIIRPEDMALEIHRAIYQAALALRRAGRQIDPVLIRTEAARMGAELDGAYLLELMDRTPTAANVKEYAKITRTEARRRELGAMLQRAQTAAAKEEPEEVLSTLAREAAELQQEGTTDELIRPEEALLAFYAHRDAVDQGGSRAVVSTGYLDLDSALGGGMVANGLYILAARPGMGKSSFALNIATRVAMKQHIPVAIFSLEMTKEQLTNRILSAEAGIDSQAFRTGALTASDWEYLALATEKLHDAPIYMDDTSAITITEMKAKIRRINQDPGRPNIGLIVIDYLQLMTSGQRSENRVQEISSITRNLKIMAKEMDVPIIALSQLSRAVEKQGNNSSHRPQLSDLRDSGSIEQDADCVLFLYRDSYYASQQPDGADVDADTAECIVAKNRHGETSTVPLGWDGAHTRFMDVDFGH